MPLTILREIFKCLNFCSSQLLVGCLCQRPLLVSLLVSFVDVLLASFAGVFVSVLCCVTSLRNAMQVRRRPLPNSPRNASHRQQFEHRISQLSRREHRVAVALPAKTKDYSAYLEREKNAQKCSEKNEIACVVRGLWVPDAEWRPYYDTCRRWQCCCYVTWTRAGNAGGAGASRSGQRQQGALGAVLRLEGTGGGHGQVGGGRGRGGGGDHGGNRLTNELIHPSRPLSHSLALLTHSAIQ